MDQPNLSKQLYDSNKFEFEEKCIQNEIRQIEDTLHDIQNSRKVAEGFQSSEKVMSFREQQPTINANLTTGTSLINFHRD